MTSRIFHEQDSGDSDKLRLHTSCTSLSRSLSAWKRTLEATRFAASSLFRGNLPRAFLSQLADFVASRRTADRLKPWFDQVRLMMGTHHYSPGLVFNMDKTGYATGITLATRALFVVDRIDGEGVGRGEGDRNGRPRLPRVDRNG